MSDSPLRKVRRPEGLREALPGLRRLVPGIGPDRFLARDIEASVAFVVGGGALIEAGLVTGGEAWTADAAEAFEGGTGLDDHPELARGADRGDHGDRHGDRHR